MDTYVGDVRLFPYTFAPEKWMACRGQLLTIVNNEALYALLGTQYGGNGVSTFGLPNLIGTEPSPFMEYCICVDGLFPPRQ